MSSAHMSSKTLPSAPPPKISSTVPYASAVCRPRGAGPSSETRGCDHSIRLSCSTCTCTRHAHAMRMPWAYHAHAMGIPWVHGCTTRTPLLPGQEMCASRARLSIELQHADLAGGFALTEETTHDEEQVAHLHGPQAGGNRPTGDRRQSAAYNLSSASTRRGLSSRAQRGNPERAGGLLGSGEWPCGLRRARSLTITERAHVGGGV